MPAPKWMCEDYDRAADEYQRKLSLEHYAETSLAAAQRGITLVSLMVVRGLMGGLHVFNELLVQFFSRGHLVQVVPDNMVVRGELEDRPRKSYAADEEPVPFWVLEDVSRGTERKDYVENRRIYEQELIEAKARSAGRDDVLAALPTAEPTRLSAWLAELP